MNSSDTRISSYLDDLARMLTDLDPADRDEVLAGVREHLDATLAEHPEDPAAVDAALLRLGPPERIATEARAGLPERPPPSPRRNPVWGRVAVVSTMVAILPVVVVPVLPRLAFVTYDAEAMAVWPNGFELVLLLFPVWVLSLAATLMADRLSNAIRSRMATLAPVAAVASTSTSLWWSPEVLSSVVTVALLVTIAVVTVRAGRAGWAATRR